MTTEAAAAAAATALANAKKNGYGLVVLTGAGMSVSSGVPVFRHADGSMSAEFLSVLQEYNRACRQHNLLEADDWFNFSVSDMFRKETELEAWHYWRWRILRAQVKPARDYWLLRKIVNYFGKDKCFIVTSNCDCLHYYEESLSGAPCDIVKEIHGSLSKVQCSGPCCKNLWPVNQEFVQRLKDEPSWVPRCPTCKRYCLRPNVMIFNDQTLVYTRLSDQNNRWDEFQKTMNGKWIVLEIGAGVVVPSIRYQAEMCAAEEESVGLVRINPSENECKQMETSSKAFQEKFYPVSTTASEALELIAKKLGLVD